MKLGFGDKVPYVLGTGVGNCSLGNAYTDMSAWDIMRLIFHMDEKSLFVGRFFVLGGLTVGCVVCARWLSLRSASRM